MQLQSQFFTKEQIWEEGGELTGSAVTAEVTHAGLEVRGLESARLVGHSHDADTQMFLYGGKKEILLTLQHR